MEIIKLLYAPILVWNLKVPLFQAVFFPKEERKCKNVIAEIKPQICFNVCLFLRTDALSMP